MGWLKETIPEDLAVLIKGANLLHIQTNYAWTTSLVGSGVLSQQVAVLSAATGTTANSQALGYITLRGFGLSGEVDGRMTWDKKLYLIFNYTRILSDAQVVARVQMKETQAQGALGAKGIGIRADNLSLVGESYGTVLGEVDLATTLTSSRDVQIVIVHNPSVPKIEWYVNGALKGTQSTASKIPSGGSGDTSRIVHSIINGAAGGVDAESMIHHPKLWQRR